MNDRGQVVGWSGWCAPIPIVLDAFLWTAAEGLVDRSTRIVDDCGCRLRSAEAINDHGEIVGTMLVGDRMHAFLLPPV